MKRFCPLLLGAVLLGLAAGCPAGPKLIVAKGKLLAKDQQFKMIDPKGGLTVVFVPVVEKGANFDSYPADVNRDDMTFVVKGKEGRGIPEGKYKVTINQMSMTKSADMDRMNNQFGPERTAIVREVKADGPPIVIDVSKPEG